MDPAKNSRSLSVTWSDPQPLAAAGRAMAGIEFLLINNDTTISGFKKELRWNDMYYALAKGL